MLYISVETFGAFALTCLVIELTPGPNMAYLAVLSAGNGRRAGFAATLGIALGLLRDSALAPAVARARRASFQAIYKIRRFTPARLTSVGANRLEASVQDPWTS
jgi:threonine/homoserine/homoserine lactone efflux protein